MFERGWIPARDLQTLQEEMDSLFSGLSGTVHSFPPVNVWTNENDAVVIAELPGVNPNEIDISVQGDSFTLRGSRVRGEPKEYENYFRRERLHGEFARTLRLPFHVDSEKVTARYDKGVLSVTLPRAEADKPKKISIKAA